VTENFWMRHLIFFCVRKQFSVSNKNFLRQKKTQPVSKAFFLQHLKIFCSRKKISAAKKN